MNKMKKILEKIKQDINGYHDIVSDLRDEWNNLDGIFDMEVERENSILRGIQSLTDSFEEDIFKSVAMIEKIQKGNE